MASPYQTEPQSTSADTPDKIQQLKAKAQEAAGTLAKSTEETAENAYVAVTRFVRDQPLLALGLTAGLAFAAGALWKLSAPNRTSLIDRISDYVEPQYRALRGRH